MIVVGFVLADRLDLEVGDVVPTHFLTDEAGETFSGGGRSMEAFALHPLRGSHGRRRGCGSRRVPSRSAAQRGHRVDAPHPAGIEAHAASEPVHALAVVLDEGVDPDSFLEGLDPTGESLPVASERRKPLRTVSIGQSPLAGA